MQKYMHSMLAKRVIKTTESIAHLNTLELGLCCGRFGKERLSIVGWCDAELASNNSPRSTTGSALVVNGARSFTGEHTAAHSCCFKSSGSLSACRHR
jgi:hypothetical protein